MSTPGREIITMYLHRNKDENAEMANKLGLTGEAAREFQSTCYEVELGLELDRQTGQTRIVTVDGRTVL